MKGFLKTLTGKWWFWLIAAVVLSWGSWEVFVLYDTWKANAPYRERYASQMAEYAKYEAQQLALEAQYAADFNGGETPQETWDLFVAALERGDTDEAAKYYIPEKQAQEKEEWRIAKELGNIEIFLQDFELIEGETMYPNGERFEFYTGSIDGGPGFVYVLIKNPITGVWKIEDL